MPGRHHLLVDPLQNLRREQAQVVLQRLQLVIRLIVPVAVPQHVADGFVLVGQILNPVVVGVQSQPQHPQHQNVPLRHARPAGIRAGFALRIGLVGQNLFEYTEHPLAQIVSDVDVLQPF